MFCISESKIIIIVYDRLYSHVLSAEVNCELEVYTHCCILQKKQNALKNTMSGIVLYRFLHHCNI